MVYIGTTGNPAIQGSPHLAGSKSLTPNEHPNPLYRLKWVANSPTNLSFDNHSHLETNHFGLWTSFGLSRMPEGRDKVAATASRSCKSSSLRCRAVSGRSFLAEAGFGVWGLADFWVLGLRGLMEFVVLGLAFGGMLWFC